MARNYTISRAVPRDPADEYAHDQLFSTTRKYAGLNIDTGHISGGNVVTMSDEPDQFDNAVSMAAADVIGGRYPFARAGMIRRALRPASHGAGRDRWR
jgi:hypothetical protein